MTLRTGTYGIRTRVERAGLGSLFLWSAALCAGCGSPDPLEDGSGEEVGTIQQALVQHRVRLHVYTVSDLFFFPPSMTTAVNRANTVWGSRGPATDAHPLVQFDFHELNDVSSSGFDSSLCQDGNKMARMGDELIGKLAVFWCPDGAVSWAIGVHNIL